MSLPPDEDTWYRLYRLDGGFFLISKEELDEIAPWEDMTWD